MSIATIITAIETSRNTIRTKLVELGLVGSAAKLDACAAAIESIIKHGTISATVKEGETFNIPAGYHDGSGTVSGVGGGGNYNLQSKTITPTKKQQTVTPDAGYFGLSDVIVQMIPDNYQDVSSVTAAAGDVLTGKIIVTATGEVIAGDMPNNGAVSKTLDATTITYSIPKGYHNGEGVVKITLEEKNVTPTKSQQVVTPTSGKVLSKVTVGAIPDKFQDTTNVDATPAGVLSGVTYVDGTGEHEGAMPNNGAVDKNIDGLTVTSVSVPAGYTSGGTVALTDDIENALAAI